MQSKKLKIGLLGYGKMGRTIDGLASDFNAEIVWRIDASNRSSLTRAQIQTADVVIEFSHPNSGFDNIMDCLIAGVPTISGTTGWLEKYDLLAEFCKKNKGTFLYASNFSIGVNLFFALNRKLAKIMEPWPNYSPSLSETHHVHKKDAPSGTAISLAKGIIKTRDSYKDWHLTPQNAPQNSLPITSIRSDEVPGTHDITWKSDVDEIRIEHIAHSRDGFAAGALIAAHWIADKKGVFQMEEVLGI